MLGVKVSAHLFVKFSSMMMKNKDWKFLQETAGQSDQDSASLRSRPLSWRVSPSRNKPAAGNKAE